MGPVEGSQQGGSSALPVRQLNLPRLLHGRLSQLAGGAAQTGSAVARIQEHQGAVHLAQQAQLSLLAFADAPIEGLAPAGLTRGLAHRVSQEM